ncbi:MAG: PEP-CTERM sorting domain-containing protein [Pirellulales bacterium]|nr:PEP-CTERM sorting domain-containing protein [Pirellulales bacterium]
MSDRRATVLLSAVAVCLFGASAAHGQSVTIGFEPPTYAAGDLIGQNGWVKNAYYPSLNGTVNVSATSPLVGSQSLSYTQTVAGGFSDVSKADAILAPPGVTGTDVTLSYVIKATTGSFDAPNGGIFLGNGAAGGASPIFARINGGVVEVGSAGAIVPINEFFFSPGERLKMTYEIDFDNSTMNFILENLDFGDLFTQSFPFFAPFGNPDGPNGEYTVDVAAFLRGGNVQIDDIMLTPGVGPLVTEFEWTATGSGNWNQANNWSPAGLPGTIPGRQTALLGSSITANQTIYNNAVRNLNSLEINNANGYTITGAGSLAFQSDSSGTSTIPPTLTVAAGAHQIQIPITLEDNTAITVAAGASLDLNNLIDLNGHTLTTSGNVRINHSAMGGGTINSVGALSASGVASLEGNLISSGALLVAWNENGADSFTVSGDAAVSGVLDVVWDPASLPSGSVTVLSAGGTLDASNLRLAAGDARAFALGVEGNSINLTFLGVAVPEPASLAMLLLGMVAALFRRPRVVAIRCAASASLAAVALSAAHNASAVQFDFEAPTFTAGSSIIGQDGWATNAYVLADPFFGGVTNGDVTISGVSPLAGAQSVLYNQTSKPAGAGGTGASDVGKAGVFTVAKHGTPAIDLQASFLLQADANGIGNGSVGFFLGKGARSPILLLISGASSGSGTGDILVGHDFALPSVGGFTAGNVYEFTIGVDLDGQNYEASGRNVTSGTAAVTFTGPGPGGRFPFFGGAYPDNGDGLTYTFDTSLLLRSGAGRIDNISVTPIPEPGALALAAAGLAAGLAFGKRSAAMKRLLTIGSLVTFAVAQTASAVSFTFEPPTYAVGPIAGQDSWVGNAYILADPFFGGVVNGTVEVSSATPLAGTQSVLYTQTSIPAGAGATGGSDVGRPYSVFAVEDGTDAVDLTASVLMSTNSNGVGNGQIGFFLGEGGRSPIFALLSNANSTAGTGEILVGHDFALPSVGTYVAGNTYELTFGVDLDGQNYEVFARNVTAGGTATKLAGPGPDGRFPFFGGAFGDDGDGQTYTFDTSLLLRSGVGRVDNITAVGDDFTQAVWNAGSGSWTQNTSWIPNLIPNVPGAGVNAPRAIFDDHILEPQTIFTNTTQTVNGLSFDSAQKYVIGGSGAIALRANSVGGAVAPTINVLSGAHELQAAVNVLDNATVTVSPGATLDFNNTVSLGGRTLTTAGDVNLNIGVTGGGAIVNGGTLGTAGPTPIAANLTSTGALRVDLGPANTDAFNITGNATLSGLIDVVLEPGFTPSGSYTVLTATGSLNAAGLALDPSDLGQFSLSVVGNSLQLTVGGGGIPGDFNNDGIVNATDLNNFWKPAFGKTAAGDADDDNDTDGRDFLIWQRNFGQGSAAPASAAVPEPHSILLIVTTLISAAALFRVDRQSLRKSAS